MVPETAAVATHSYEISTNLHAGQCKAGNRCHRFNPTNGIGAKGWPVEKGPSAAADPVCQKIVPGMSGAPASTYPGLSGPPHFRHNSLSVGSAIQRAVEIDVSYHPPPQARSEVALPNSAAWKNEQIWKWARRRGGDQATVQRRVDHVKTFLLALHEA